MHVLALALPVVALALVVLLLRWLRGGLRRLIAGDASASRELAETHAEWPDDGLWDRVAARWGRWGTVVLPVVVGVVVLGLTAWLLAYLGWAAAYVTDQTPAHAPAPPWFGGVGMLLFDAFWGGVTAFFVGAFGAVLLGITYFVGRFVLWPGSSDDGDHDAPNRG